MNQSDVTACLVTRGNVDMQPILDSLIFDNVIVWDNSKRVDEKAYGRYAAAEEAPTDVVYFQDDDVILDAGTQQALLSEWKPGEYLTNMEQGHNRAYPGLNWCAWGAVTERKSYRDAFARWFAAGNRIDEPGFKLHGADIVFSLLHPNTRNVDLGRSHQSYAFGADRLYQAEGYDRMKVDFYNRAKRLAEGVKLNLGCGGYPLPGFVNLDAQNGWRFEHGLGSYPDGSVSAVTISHALMYVPQEEWPEVFSEFARVLKPGGVLRVTEDSTDDPLSERFGGHHDAVTLTTRELVRRSMKDAGFIPYSVPAGQSFYRDDSLIQNRHGGEPKVFFCEGVRV